MQDHDNYMFQEFWRVKPMTVEAIQHPLGQQKLAEFLSWNECRIFKGPFLIRTLWSLVSQSDGGNAFFNAPNKLLQWRLIEWEHVHYPNPIRCVDITVDMHTVFSLL